MKAAFLRSPRLGGHGHREVVHPSCVTISTGRKYQSARRFAYRWDGKRGQMFFRIVSDSYNDIKLIDFLTQLRKEVPRKKLILIWDGLPSHRSRVMTNYLNMQRKRLSVVRLPAYAPELNPVESAWSNIQSKELANLCTDGLGGMVEGVHNGFDRIHSQRQLLDSFLTHAGFSFD